MKTYHVHLNSVEPRCVKIKAQMFEICDGQLFFLSGHGCAQRVVAVFAAGQWLYLEDAYQDDPRPGIQNTPRARGNAD